MAQLVQELQDYVQSLLEVPLNIAGEKKEAVESLTRYVIEKTRSFEEIKLNFICTHNSRRSQLSQVWAQTAAWYYDIPKVKTYSGGVEVTAFNERAVRTLEGAGFVVARKEMENNPIYFVRYSDDADPIPAFSKLFDDALNAHSNFAAVMTCSDADENCPFIPGAETRIPLRYEDPKVFDGTAIEEEKYEERSRQIARELFHVFSVVKQALT